MFEISFGSAKLIIDTGNFAKQANGSVMVRFGETAILSTAVMAKEPLPCVTDITPLTVDYRERVYAAGKIPGGFFKREGRPRENEIITSRLIDRSIRPYFPAWLNYNVQINNLVLSFDGLHGADIPSLIATSCALMLSDIPFSGPISAVRVGMVGDNFIINPTFFEQQSSTLDLVVAGKSGQISMLEGFGKEIKEEVIIKAVEYAQPFLDRLEEFQKDLAKFACKSKLSVGIFPQELADKISAITAEKLNEIITIQERKIRSEKYRLLEKDIIEQFVSEECYKETIKALLWWHFRNKARKYVLEKGIRLDGRACDAFRPITCEVGILPRTHGSAIFTRGQTQALVTVTLGTPQDMQVMDELAGEYKERFIFHYNFPSFATGEALPDRAPSRREVGHGALARRALLPILPEEKYFPYTIRIVSDILESNGSSSMASVCGASLAFYDAGIPIQASVAGVALGLIKEDNTTMILTDIDGLEDHFGDMDFKIAGTKEGITALQMDLKIPGIDIATLAKILQQGRIARKQILSKMDENISSPRESISMFAPRIALMYINRDKIGDLIGPGGKNIRQIIEQTGVEINVEPDGRVFISGTDDKSVELAKNLIESYVSDVVVGKTYTGKVIRITDFGAFVEIFPGKEGLLHISQISFRHVDRVEDELSEGDIIKVKVIDIDSQGRIALSRKAVLQES